MGKAERIAEIPGYGNGYVVARKGDIVRLTDIEGCQVGDLFAVNPRDHTEYLSTSVTRLAFAPLVQVRVPEVNQPASKPDSPEAINARSRKRLVTMPVPP